MTILDQIKSNANYLLQTKKLIREAIIEQGVEVAEGTPFQEYPRLVASIGGGVDYKEPAAKRNGTIAGELDQILDTKERLREVLIAQGVEITDDTPFREYSKLIGEIIPISLAGLKLALNRGIAQTKFPIGTEIPDTWNGEDNPLIVAQYADIPLSDFTTIKPGVYLVRKYVDPIAQVYGGMATPNYKYSSIKAYLQSQYLESCSEEVKESISEINVPSYVATSSPAYLEQIPSKFFLMSAKEVGGVRDTSEGIFWEYWKQRTGWDSPSDNDNPGRVMRSRDDVARAIWLRTYTGNVYQYYVRTDGLVTTKAHTQSATDGVLPACAIVAD